MDDRERTDNETLLTEATQPHWVHLDHEVTQLLGIQRLVRRWWYRFLPEVVRHSVRVAYAAHLRVFLEFAHDRRPSRAQLRAVGCEEPSNVCASDLLGKPLSEKWSVEELKRLCDADKLVGHLTEDRPRREEAEREWGGDEDSKLLKAPIRQLLREASSRLPKAARAARAFRWD